LGKIFDALEKSGIDRAAMKAALDAPGTPKAKPKAVKPMNNHAEKSVKTLPPGASNTGEPAGKVLKAAKRLKAPYPPVDKNLITLNDPSGFESEQFKILRTSLLFPASGKTARTILVTSSLPGEGKSFVAANLAVSMAQNINEHVLLIDGDIRKPTIHTTFGYRDVLGLSEHLSKGTPLSDLILKTRVEKLSLLPSGNPPHNPSELLSSEAMSSLIQETKNRYNDRYIIIDSPPPRFTSETSALARQVDGIIIVINGESTPKAMSEKLVEIVGKEKILGIVMNRFRIPSSKYYGYGKYGVYGQTD
jgi:exopolysaccharide/PEP-CTERM locus tyrosine autokinase